MNTLYPLKFEPILKEKIWGGNKLSTVLNKPQGSMQKIGESWELSGLEGDLSVVANGFLAGNTIDELIEIYMGDLVGDAVFVAHDDQGETVGLTKADAESIVKTFNNVGV